MQCPECKDSHLTPTKLEPSLGAMGCQSCGGDLINLVAYRLWRDQHESQLSAEPSVEKKPEDGNKALSCSKCQRIMQRYRYTADTKHQLDICTHCDEVWLQEGEWDFLKAVGLAGELSLIFSSPWQKRRRESQQKLAMQDDWIRRFGEDLHDHVADVHEWLNAHPKRKDLLLYLSQQDPYDI